MEGVAAGDIQAMVDQAVTSAHVEHYAVIVRDQYLKRKSRVMSRGFVEKLDAGVSVAVQGLQQELVELMSEATAGRGASLASSLEDVQAEFEEAHRIRMVEKRLDYCPGIPMPWRFMTVAYNGLQPGLHIIGARPSTGKTALVVNKIRYWCEACGFDVAVNSLDMQPAQLMKRFVTEVSRVSLPKMSFGTTSERDMEVMRKARQRVGGWPLHVAVKRDLEEFRSWCVMMKMKHDVKVIIVDFLQLLTFRDCYRMGVDDRVSHISGTLKAIGNDLGVPVIALSQLNRECERDGGREPEISDLRGSGALEQDAFTILMLHRDAKTEEAWGLCPPSHLAPFGSDPNARAYLAAQLRPVWALLKKNQNGRTARIPMVLFPSYFLFMMGDYLAASEPIRKGAGDNERIVGYDDTPRFSRVLGDWRKDALEGALAKSRGLVSEYVDGDTARGMKEEV